MATGFSAAGDRQVDAKADKGTGVIDDDHLYAGGASKLFLWSRAPFTGEQLGWSPKWALKGVSGPQCACAVRAGWATGWA